MLLLDKSFDIKNVYTCHIDTEDGPRIIIEFEDEDVEVGNVLTLNNKIVYEDNCEVYN